ncbi:MAG: lipoyl(octanoyl) transferase LipB [Streptosporangiales bacterium]|nr:lipoyl(octanoyl) transferase LipB [Streptosporangiales bacterium]
MRFIRLGFGADAVRYETAWDIQRSTHEAVTGGAQPDTCLLLEHQAVYTAGKRTQVFERPNDGTPVVDVDRGGRITWHGPGQLTGYPIVHLSDPVDVVAYVRAVEEMLIRVCADLGVAGTRVEGRSGVWFPADATRQDRKVGAIGIRVAQGVTMHGFALNCDNSLDPYHQIVPCGLTDVGTTTLSAELGRQVPVAEVLPLVEKHLTEVLGYPGYELADNVMVAT